MIVNSEMHQEGSECFDLTPTQNQTLAESGFSQTIVPNCRPTFSMEEEQVFLHPHQDAAAAASAMEFELQHQMGLDNIENCYNPNNNIETHLMQDPNHQPNWDPHPEMNNNYHHQIQETHNTNNNSHHQTFINSETPYPQTPDLLNLLHLPNSSVSLTNPTGSGSSVLYDPMFHLNLPLPPPLFRDMFKPNYPHEYNLPGGSSLFNGVEEREETGEFDTGILDFSRDINGKFSKGKGRRGKDTKHFATERQRREHLTDKYKALNELVPNPSKTDRASVVGYAIEYIKELQRTVNELKVLVEKKRYSRERVRRNKIDDNSVFEGESSTMGNNGDSELGYNASTLRSSWLQRKSKNIEVDVRIVDDEVTIKLVQQKRINCLLFVSKVLDELQLDLQHVAGGLIGDFYSFLFNTRICEGSSVYASAIANKLIDAVDRQYAAASQPTSSY